MEGPERTVEVTEEGGISDGVYAVQCETQGTLRKLTGRIEEKYLDTESRIYVRVNHDKIYEACPMDVAEEEGNSCGFCLYLSEEKLAVDGNEIEILTGDNNSARLVGELTL